MNHKPFTAKIESISQEANLTIRFSDLLKPQSNLTLIQESINLTLIPHLLPEEFDEGLIAFDWEVKKLKEDFLIIQIKFENPLYISMDIT